MGFAASNSTIVYQQFPGDSPAAILTALISNFESAQWTPAGPYLGGLAFIIQSPPSQPGLPSQNLGAIVRVFIDPTFSISGIPQVGVQLTSLDGTRLGFVHHLQGSPGRVFQVWANICQFFISQPGIAVDVSGQGFSACAGGIPCIPANLLGTCGKDIGPVLATEAWWSGGDEDTSNGTNWRFTYICNPFSACYNGDLMCSVNFTTYTERSRLHILPMALCVPVGHTFGAPPRMRWFGGGSLFFDPIISWGSGASSDTLALVRGQLWDSFVVSTEQVLDLRATIADLNYINYTQDNGSNMGTTSSASRFMALFLLLGAPSGVDFNYMY